QPRAIELLFPYGFIRHRHRDCWPMLYCSDHHFQKAWLPPVIVFQNRGVGFSYAAKGMVEVCSAAAVSSRQGKLDSRVTYCCYQFRDSIVFRIVVESLCDPSRVGLLPQTLECPR